MSSLVRLNTNSADVSVPPTSSLRYLILNMGDIIVRLERGVIRGLLSSGMRSTRVMLREPADAATLSTTKLALASAALLTHI